MTVPAYTGTEMTSAESLEKTTVRLVETRLRDAAARLGAGVTTADVRDAQQAIGAAEQALGSLVHDPWEPSAKALSQARQILSSHLLAASACEGADVATPVTARVLRRGADSARLALADHEHKSGSPRPRF